MPRCLTVLCASSLALTALTGPTATAPAVAAAAQGAPVVQGAPVTARASAAAAAFVASRPAVIHPGPDDRYTAQPTVTGAAGLHFTPYRRTYRGLPVLGGDFVVVTDAGGAVVSTSAGAQRQTLTLATGTAVDAATAATVARRTLPGGAVQRTTEVVDAMDDTATIAWEAVVAGTRGAVPSRLHVVVDGTTGAVRRSWDEVVAGTGTAAYNGPNPVSIATSGSAGAFTMTDPTRPGVSCREFRSGTVLAGTDDAWGDGDAATVETGCVDALYDVAHEWDMLRDWLGRDGIDGAGRGFPVLVGLDDENAYWDGSGVSIGHNTAGKYVAAQDVTGHEFGHAVDSTTPGGQSGNGVSEATGDIFGTALEFYSNQSSSYDPPDWTIGEEVDLLGEGPIRDLADPTREGDPVCFSGAVPRAETHAAAGPFDHWFYLVSGGRAAAGGSTVSRCNGATVSGGLGVRAALTVFYQAMLAKTSLMSYPRYRTATLAAAKNLHPGNCRAFATVQAAWNAIKVPAQPAEPTCTPGEVVVADPGARSGTVGSAVSSFTLQASGGNGAFRWSATGLPAGLTLDAAAGTVSGTPTAAGTSTVTVTARSGPARGHARFAFTVNPAPGDGCAAGQLLADPGFETSAGWNATANVLAAGTTAQPAHGGSRLAFLGGYGTMHTDAVKQDVTVPAGCTTVTLSFWLGIDTAQTGRAAVDTLLVKYGATPVVTLSNLDAGGGYVQRSFAVSAAAQTATVAFVGREDGAGQTSFLLDDVALAVS